MQLERLSCKLAVGYKLRRGGGGDKLLGFLRAVIKLLKAWQNESDKCQNICDGQYRISIYCACVSKTMVMFKRWPNERKRCFTKCLMDIRFR